MSRIEPARQFTFEIACQDEVERVKGDGFVIAALFGLLDTILVADLTPYRDVRIVLTELIAHEVDSNQLAFYRAGREAGRLFLEAVRKTAYRFAEMRYITCRRRDRRRRGESGESE